MAIPLPKGTETELKTEPRRGMEPATATRQVMWTA